MLDRETFIALFAYELRKSWQRFLKRQQEKRYRRRRVKRLLKLLGNICKMCKSTEDLTIDHVNGRDYNIRKLSSKSRASTYWQEYRAGVPLQVLCRGCNTRKENQRRAET